jgi:hypothetical protein
MVLQRSNFEIPVQFIFQPFDAHWRAVNAETVEWVEEPRIQMAFRKTEPEPEKNQLKVRIDEGARTLAAMLGVNLPSPTIRIDRASIPPNVLMPHENWRNTPDVSGRNFMLLVCETKFVGHLPQVIPGIAKKNAWIMRDEFLNLPDGDDSDWVVDLRRFLNKWGLWGRGQGLQFLDGPDDVMVFIAPHLLKEQQESYRRALLPTHRKNWLRSHPMTLQTVDEPPYFHVRGSYLSDAINTTITIDHLAERQFGICKRCHAVFEKETKHKRDYCSRTCINAANVQRWRDEQRKSRLKGAKRNAKS